MQKNYQANAKHNDRKEPLPIIAKFSLRAKHEQWKPCWTEASGAFSAL